jgi:ribosomal protein S18 acetylase RimI-like enzyme
MDAAALQGIARRGWPEIEAEALGAWVLRAAGGFTRRANSVLAFGEPGRPLDDAIARVRAFYGARGLPPYFQLSDESPVDRELAARGWVSEAPVRFEVADLNALTSGGEGVVLARRPEPAWLARYHKAGALSPAALHVLGSPDVVCFASLPGEDPALARAIGRCVIVDGWAGFSAIEVDPAYRRRGLATRVMAALIRFAREAGATRAYLQVETANQPALTLYERMGFTTHHRYHYRRA